MSMVAIRAAVAQALTEYRTDQARPEPERRPVSKPSEHSVVEQLRGAVALGDPAMYRDPQGQVWWCYDDTRWPARQPRNDDGTPKAQSGAVRVFDGIPDGWVPEGGGE